MTVRHGLMPRARAAGQKHGTPAVHEAMAGRVGGRRHAPRPDQASSAVPAACPDAQAHWKL